MSNPWHNGGDPDYDYSVLVTNTTGTVLNSKIGNAVGWLGRSWNFSPAQAEMSFGYPAGSPFPGSRIMQTAATEWYENDFTAGGQVSKFIGSDQNGGSSGGPWILGWGHGSAEVADTDGSDATDPGPGALWVNGVNSHKRCSVACFTPPTSTQGTFWQEQSSPPFRSDGADANDSEDVVLIAFNNGGDD